MDITKLILESNLINFVIAVGITSYLLIKVIPQSTTKRKTEIQKELLQAQEAKKAAEAKLEELKIEIENAKKESLNIIESAKANSEALRAQIMKDAKLELDRMNANASREIEMHKEMTINTIKEQISHLTMKNVEKTLLEKKSEIDKLIKLKLNKDLKEQVA
jgi:F-type H+-transporting ATPase subunit b